MKKFANLLACCIVSVLASLGLVYALTPIVPSIPYGFVTGTVANATQVNQNFVTFQSDLNGFQTGGSWIPVDASGAGLVFTGVSASYTQIGNMVFAQGALTYPNNFDFHNALIGGLPFNFPVNGYGAQCVITSDTAPRINTMWMIPAPNSNLIQPWVIGLGVPMGNYQMPGKNLTFECIYPAQ